MTKTRHKHNSIISRVRHSVRYNRKPKPVQDRFTYRAVTVDGETGFVFLNQGRPLFKDKAIKCERVQALHLVKRLNRIPSWHLDTHGEKVIEEWFESVSDAQKADAEIAKV